jgi:hypothetical protein
VDINISIKWPVLIRKISDFKTICCKKNQDTEVEFKAKITKRSKRNQRLPGACNHSPGSKLLSITTQLHCGTHLGGRARLPDTILEEDHQMAIPSKFGSN